MGSRDILDPNGGLQADFFFWRQNYGSLRQWVELEDCRLLGA